MTAIEPVGGMFPRRCGACGGVVSGSDGVVPVEVRGETIMVADIDHAVCTLCGEIFLSSEAVETLQKEAIRRMKEAKGLLTPDEIRALRESLGLSQAAFEKLIGVGPKTVVRWEKGTVFQSASADRLMRLIRAMPEIVEVLSTSIRRSSPPLCR